MMTELSQIISQIEPVNPGWLAQARERLDSLTKPRGGLGINVLARHAGARVAVVDIGVTHDFGRVPELIDRKVAYGSRNMAQEPALTREEALQALLVGVEMAAQATAPGGDAPAAGALAAVGGLEIAGVAGFILGTAAARRPLVLDGFIATAGALVAKALAPTVTDYLIAAHRSVDPGHPTMLDFLGLKPLLQFQMRLGEGTGAALGLTLLEAGVRAYREMATFGEAGVADQDT